MLADKMTNPRSELGRAVTQLKQLPDGPDLSLIKRHDPVMTPWLSKLGTTEQHISPELSEASLSQSSQFLKRYLTCLSDGFSSQLGTHIDGPKNLDTERLVSPVTIESYQDTLYWTNIVETCVAASRTGGWMKIMNTWCSRRMCLIYHAGSWIALTYDAVLMMKDMMYSRFLIHSLSALDKTRRHLTTTLQEFLDWGNRVLARFGNTGYELIKGLESLAKVRIILHVEKWLDATKQAREMVSKYRVREQKMGGTGNLTDQLWAFLHNMRSPSEVSEAFGFLKLLGHPYVDPRAGCAKVQGLVFTPDLKDPESCKALGRSFCHVYLRGYLDSKGGKWPPMAFQPRPDGKLSSLERLYRKEQPSLAFGFSQYDAEDWDYVNFEKHIEFDMGENILELMSDRALSHPRSTFDAMWYGKLDYPPPRATGSKRVLEQLLQKDDLNMRDIVCRVQEWDIPEDWKIVSISPKEREMKLDPRMFAKMVLEMRSFFVLTEKNLKDGAFKLLKEQTMTLSRQELISRFLSVTKPKGPRFVKLIVEIDFSSWNLHFDVNNCDPVGVRLNEIYGQPGVFTAVHRFFKECLIVMDNGDYPPEGLNRETRQAVIDGEMYLDTVWSGHERGFEGITQGIWTAITIAIGHFSVQDMGIPFVVNGQGDNQVYCFELYIPDGLSEDEIRSYVRNLERVVLSRLERAAALVGHEIKPEECMCSTSYFSYGKEMFADGVYLPSLSKFLSRVFPTTSSDSPSSYEYIATVASGGTAATEKSNVSLPCLGLSKFVEHITISREMERSLLHREALKKRLFRYTSGNPVIRTVLLDLMCIIPGNLGGLPVSSPLEFLYRGHSDPLASSFCCMQLLRTYPGLESYMICMDKGWFFKPDPEPAGLIQDPYSLPLQTEPPSSSVVAREVVPVLLDAINNKSLEPLKQSASSESRDILFGWLASLLPMYPKVIHDLYKSSPIGVIDSLAKRFTNTRTLKNMAKASGRDLTYTSISADLNFMLGMIDRVALVFKVDSTSYDTGFLDNPYRTLQRWRLTWKMGLLSGVTNLHPLSGGLLSFLPDDSGSVTCNEEIVVMCPEGSSILCENTRGPLTPFLGSRTDDKTVGTWVRPVDSSPPLLDVLKILTIQLMMTLPGTKSWEMFNVLARTRTSIDLDILRNFIRVKIGGTVAHRYQTRDDPKGSFVNISVNWPTHLCVSTNNAGTLGAIDYPFDFQEAITCLQGLLSWKCYQSVYYSPFGFVLRIDTTLMEPIADHIIDSDKELSLERPLSSSYYLTVDAVTVSSNAQTSARFVNHDLLATVPLTDANETGALISVFLSHMTGRVPITVKFQRTMGQISHKRLLDLAELRHILYTEFVDCLARAIRLKIGYAAVSIFTRKSRPFNSVLLRLINAEVRRVVPSLYGTFREILLDGQSDTRLTGLGNPESDKALSRLMSDVRTHSLAVNQSIPVTLFLRGSSSLSKALNSFLGHELGRVILNSGATQYKQVKLVQTMLNHIGKLEDEITKVRYMLSLARVMGVTGLIDRSQFSPEEVLRRLRTREIPVPLLLKTPVTYRHDLPPISFPRVPTGSGTVIQYQDSRLSPENLIQSWLSRSPLMNTSAIKWSPLTSCLSSQVNMVLLLGVGDGNIGPALDPAWTVVGVELLTQVAKQGQAMVDYSPPGISGKFSLHTCSWTHGGDILDDRVVRILEDEIDKGAYDLVIIDVDRVDPLSRLQLRQRLARPGVPAYCRVLVSPDDSTLLTASFLAYHEQGDRIWQSDVTAGYEYVVGGSPAPVGVQAAQQSSAPFEVPLVVSINVVVDGEPPLNTQEHALVLTGDFFDFIAPLELRMCRSIRSYLPEVVTDFKLLLEHLVSKGCPRRRIKSLLILYSLGLLTV